MSPNDLPSPLTADVDTSFPKGQAFAEWLTVAGASTEPGKLVIEKGQYLTKNVDGAFGQRWVYGTAPGFPEFVQYFSFNVPLGVPAKEQCGRAIESDLHLSTGSPAPFPSGCDATGLSPQEKALEFMLFDLSACVDDDGEPHVPPPK